MPIVCLSKRVTGNDVEFNNSMNSADSLLYLQGFDSNSSDVFDASGTDCLILRVGDKWFDRSRYVQISNAGIKVKPHSSVVVETLEKIALPLNMYGLLFGAGKNIYSGGFISCGKIDPGFSGNLRIGFHNGSSHSVILKPGDKIAYSLFLDMESEIHTRPLFTVSSSPAAVKLTRWGKFKLWVIDNWSLTNLISIIACIATIIGVFIQAKLIFLT